MSRGWLVPPVLLILSCRPGDAVTTLPTLPTLSTHWTVSPIIGGIDDTGDPAVVALVVDDGGGPQISCTGTLIAPKTVLSAAHCIEPLAAGSEEYAYFGSVVPAAVDASFVRAVQRIRNPAWNPNNEATDVDDIGVYELATEVVDVTPIDLYEPVVAGGESIRHVGFGSTTPIESNNDGSGRKREVTTTVRTVDGQIEVGGPNRGHCYGDSGGPGLIIPAGETVEKVEGVVSWGSDDCIAESWDTRVDTHVTWIRMTMSAWETAAPPPPPDAGVGMPEDAAVVSAPDASIDEGPDAPDAGMSSGPTDPDPPQQNPPDPMDRPTAPEENPDEGDLSPEGSLGGGCRDAAGSIDLWLMFGLIPALLAWKKHQRSG